MALAETRPGSWVNPQTVAVQAKQWLRQREAGETGKEGKELGAQALRAVVDPFSAALNRITLSNLVCGPEALQVTSYKSQVLHVTSVVLQVTSTTLQVTSVVLQATSTTTRKCHKLPLCDHSPQPRLRPGGERPAPRGRVQELHLSS